MSLDHNQIATQSVSACAAGSYAVTATVVDRAGGDTRRCSDADNAGPHRGNQPAKRPSASASAGANACHHGKLPEERRRRNQPQGHPRLPAAGRQRVPVKVGNEVIGAVGVAGAPGGHLDDQCAQAALARCKDLLK